MTVQIWTDCRAATLDGGDGYGLIEDAAIVIDGEHIAWIGARAELPQRFAAQPAHEHRAGGALVTPGLIDCHTHLVYGGHRAGEFEMRLHGASYEDVARAGGGIVSTVHATREASESHLLASARVRLRALLAEGVTTVEIKSGYGLSLEHERKCLAVARALGHDSARGTTDRASAAQSTAALVTPERADVRTTFLGAHAVPPEFAGRTEDYLREVLAMLPVLHAEGLVDAVDAFCERIAFSADQTRQVFEAARALGLPVKLHAEQLSDSGGAQLAAGFGALSCDHLEWLSDEGAAAMAGSGSVAVLLPGAFYFLRETRLPPVALLREHRVPMALSTDCNPGSSPCTSILLMLNMACTLFRLTPAEALAGVTRHAARALGLTDRGRLAGGLRADLAFWNVDHPAQLSYAFGANPLRASVFRGLLR